MSGSIHDDVGFYLEHLRAGDGLHGDREDVVVFFREERVWEFSSVSDTLCGGDFESFSGKTSGQRSVWVWSSGERPAFQ